MYKSNLINRFNRALFSTEYNNYDSATQNAKTDRLFEFDNFDDWFDMLITRFVEEVEEDRKYSDIIDPVDEEELRTEILNCPEFVVDMKSEYEDLLDLCSDDEE